MKRLAYGFAAALMVCALAAFGGCSSGGSASSSAASGSSSASSSSVMATDRGPSDLAEGEHSVAVELEGAKNGLRVESPTRLLVTQNTKSAVIVWSSPDISRIVIDGQEYYPVPRAGNATFEVPVSSFDTDLKVQVDDKSTGESFECTLRFDSSSLQ